jgi:hypothetical protein
LTIALRPLSTNQEKNLVALSSILIRDDDLCYFTQVETFCQVHRLLLDQRIPFSAAAIPAVSDHVQAAQGGVEGFIPPALKNRGRFYKISDNRPLCAFLRDHAEIEIVQHGFQHLRLPDGSPEFAGSNESDLAHRLDQGTEMLQEAFSRKPRFFVPPFDTVSATALALIRTRFSGISFSRYSHSLLPFWLWPSYKLAKLRARHMLSWGDFLLLSHPGSDLSFVPPLEWQTADLPSTDALVVTVHSWMYFDQHGRIRNEKLQQYEEFISRLLRQPGLTFKRFADLR